MGIRRSYYDFAEFRILSTSGGCDHCNREALEFEYLDSGVMEKAHHDAQALG